MSDADNEPLVNDTKTSLDFDEQLTKFLNWFYFLPLQAMAAACATSSCQGHCTALSQGGIFCETNGKSANSSLASHTGCGSVSHQRARTANVGTESYSPSGVDRMCIPDKVSN